MQKKHQPIRPRPTYSYNNPRHSHLQKYVKIHFENEALLTLKFTGSLENETVEQVIHAISIAAQIDYEIEDRDIWFKEQLK